MSTITKPENGADEVRWDLSELFAGIDDPQIILTLDEGAGLATQFMKQYKGKLATLTPTQLNDAYGQFEAIFSPLYKVSQYVHLVYSTDTSNDLVKSVVAKVDETKSEIGNMVVFFRLELAAMPDPEFEKFIGVPELSNYAYSLAMLRKTAQYNLSEEVEKVINLKDLTGVRALRKLYTDVTSSFQFEFEVDGELRKLNGSELRALRSHKDANVRQAAMKLFFSRYEQEKLTVSSLFNSIVKDYNIEKQLRNYPSPISIMNIGNDLADEAVAALHDVTTESYPLVHRYYKIKSKLLGLETFTLADIYAPLPKSDSFFTWEEAKEIVLDGFEKFDSEFHQFANDMFVSNRIDAPCLPTKRGGAYCSGSTPDIRPYVFLNYLGKPRDIMTIAHELGHAIHDYYAAKQTLFNFHPILPLAETASVFSEMIVTDLLLKKETDRAAKISLLTHKLEDIFATSHRQNMFSRFEMATHDAISDRLLSAPELCEIYDKELKLMFGDSVTFTPEYKWEWAAIPHIFEVPFYVYAYNFGNLLVMALYQKYLQEGASFIPKFKEFLSLGGSASPLDITATVGVDIRDPKFWRLSMDYIESLLSQLEQLLAEGPV